MMAKGLSVDIWNLGKSGGKVRDWIIPVAQSENQPPLIYRFPLIWTGPLERTLRFLYYL